MLHCFFLPTIITFSSLMLFHFFHFLSPVCPNLILEIILSSLYFYLLFFLYPRFFIYYNHLPCFPSSRCFCHILKIAWLKPSSHFTIFYFHVYNWFSCSFTAASANSFPVIPLWAGTQQNLISNPIIWFWNTICNILINISFLFSEWPLSNVISEKFESEHTNKHTKIVCFEPLKCY